MAWPSRVYGVSTTRRTRGSVRTWPPVWSLWMSAGGAWCTLSRQDRSGARSVGGGCDGDDGFWETKYARTMNERVEKPRANKNMRVTERCRRICRQLIIASSTPQNTWIRRQLPDFVLLKNWYKRSPLQAATENVTQHRKSQSQSARQNTDIARDVHSSSFTVLFAAGLPIGFPFNGSVMQWLSLNSGASLQRS